MKKIILSLIIVIALGSPGTTKAASSQMVIDTDRFETFLKGILSLFIDPDLLVTDSSKDIKKGKKDKNNDQAASDAESARQQAKSDAESEEQQEESDEESARQQAESNSRGLKNNPKDIIEELRERKACINEGKIKFKFDKIRKGLDVECEYMGMGNRFFYPASMPFPNAIQIKQECFAENFLAAEEGFRNGCVQVKGSGYETNTALLLLIEEAKGEIFELADLIIEDEDQNPENELQTLLLEPNEEEGLDLSISDGNTVTIPTIFGPQGDQGKLGPTGPIGPAGPIGPIGSEFWNASGSDINNTNTGNVKINGDIYVGGICFRPAKLVRCFFTGNHLTWFDNEKECTNAGGNVEGTRRILAEC